MTKQSSFRGVLFGLLLGVSCLFSGASKADLITWDLGGASFDDGGTLSGWFTADTDTGLLVDWNITTTAGSLLAGFNFTTSSSAVYGYNVWGVNPNSFILYNTDAFAQPYLNLSFDGSWLFAGTINLDTSGFFAGSWECMNCAPVRFLVSGNATSVPVPPALALFGLGLAIMASRRRKA